MSVHIRPCNGCPLREGCEQRDDFRKRMAGVDAVSVRFRCAKLKEAMRPGRRIEILAVVGIDRSNWEGEALRRVVPATITASDGERFACVIDPEHVSSDPGDHADNVNLAKVRFRKTQRHSRIRRFLDEPNARLCENGNVQRTTGCDNSDHCFCMQMKEWAA